MAPVRQPASRNLFALPDEAELEDWQDRGVVVDPPMAHPCASWWDGHGRGETAAVLQHSITGTTQAICRIPKVGDVSDLRIDLQFGWSDRLRQSAGFERVSSSIRVAANLSSPSDIDGPAVLAVADKTELRLDLKPGERLADAFPQPTGGNHDERSWQYDLGGDLDYVIERTGARIWVQPSIDGLLLVAGAMLGVAPGFWRRRRDGPSGEPPVLAANTAPDTAEEAIERLARAATVAARRMAEDARANELQLERLRADLKQTAEERDRHRTEAAAANDARVHAEQERTRIEAEMACLARQLADAQSAAAATRPPRSDPDQESP